MKKLSIVVVGYNHLDYTKLCIESIRRNTLDIDYELIVVNNGSSDGTQEYFETLENVKIVHSDVNKGSGGGFNLGFKVCTSEYVLFVSNDLLATPNWASNLLYCIESEKKIGMVVPLCNRSSYHQAIDYNFISIEELDKFAKGYNVSNPRKWEERIRLITYCWIIRRDLFEELEGLDEYFRGAFDDDDLSFRIRRMGFKLILAGDTFIHHFGTITIMDDYKISNPLYTNRIKFVSKYNIDVWDETDFDSGVVNSINYSKYDDEVNILGINPLCGGTILQIKNKFRENGIQNVNLFAFTEAQRFCTDLKTICREVIFDNLSEISNYFKSTNFDYIIIQKPIEQYNNFEILIGSLREVLKTKGQIIF
jgi:GT2 family glycosyltransferase